MSRLLAGSLAAGEPTLVISSVETDSTTSVGSTETGGLKIIPLEKTLLPIIFKPLYLVYNNNYTIIIQYVLIKINDIFMFLLLLYLF